MHSVINNHSKSSLKVRSGKLYTILLLISMWISNMRVTSYPCELRVSKLKQRARI